MHGLLGLPGLNAPRPAAMVNNPESESVIILNQNMVVSLAQEFPLLSRIVLRMNAQVSVCLKLFYFLHLLSFLHVISTQEELTSNSVSLK